MKSKVKNMATETEEAVTEQPTIESALAKMEEAYISVFTEHLLPLIVSTSGYNPEGHLTAKATASPAGISIAVGFDFDNKNPDIMEQAQRYIFNAFLERFIEDHQARQNA